MTDISDSLAARALELVRTWADDFLAQGVNLPQESYQAYIADISALFGADRGFLFKIHHESASKPYSSLVVEWHAEGLTPISELPFGGRIDQQEAGVEALISDMLERNYAVLEADSQTGRARDLLAALGLAHVAIVPVLAGGSWWGFLGVGRCARNHPFIDDEVSILGNLAHYVLFLVKESQMKAELVKNSASWFRVLASKAVGMVRHVDGIITGINQTAVAILGGQSADQFLGKEVLSTIIHPDYRGQARTRLKELEKGASTLIPAEGIIKRADGFPIDVLISATAFRETGRLVVDIIFMDITNLKRRERQLQSLLHIQEIDTSRIETEEDVYAVMRNLLEAQKALYLTSPCVGFVHHYQRMRAATPGIIHDRLPDGPQLFADASLAPGFEEWLLSTLKIPEAVEAPWTVPDLCIEVPPSIGEYRYLACEPLHIGGNVAGVFFWCFDAPVTRKDIELDVERRRRFAEAAATAITSSMITLEHRQKSSQLAILNRASLRLNSLFSLKEIAQALLDVLYEEKGWAPSVIRFRTRHGEALETVAYRSEPGLDPAEEAIRRALMDQEIKKVGQGVTGHVIATGEPQLCLDLPSCPYYVETDRGMHYGIYAPIVVEGETLGAIGVESAEYRFTKGDLNLLVSLAEIASLAIRSVRLIEVLQERVRWLEMLHQINQKIEFDMDAKAVCAFLVDKAVESTGAESASIMILEPERQVLSHYAGIGWFNALSPELSLKDPGPSIAASVFHTGRPYIALNLEEEPNIHASSRMYIPAGQGTIVVPVKSGERTIGVFSFAFKIPLSTSDEFLSLLEMFGSYAGIAVSRANLISELQNANRQMREAYDETLKGWARAIGLRDDETLGHSARVVQIALEIGKIMGLEAQALEDLERGALLHDIGKLGIPDRILLKPGPLDPEERKIMQTHASFAYELLKPIKFLERALSVAHAHHERWDGSGYPEGLRGEEIPLLARIFAVADVYDAMTSERPYRPARTHEEALEYIRSQAGKHFDPGVVKAFLSIEDTLQSVLNLV